MAKTPSQADLTTVIGGADVCAVQAAYSRHLPPH